MTEAEIYNQALSRIGEPAATGTVVPALVALHYAFTVQELERQHRWNFLMQRTILEPAWVIPTVVSNSPSLEYRIIKVAHGLTTGERVTFDNSPEYPGTNYQGIQATWRVTVVDADTFDLDGSSIGEGAGTVDTRYALAGYYEWAFSIPAPSNMLRALDDDNAQNPCEPAWVYESGRLLTNTPCLRFQYLRAETNVAVYSKDPLFVSALILSLAIKFSVHLRGDGNPTAMLLAQQLVTTVAPIARRVDANESRTRKRLFPRQSDFVRARFAGGYDWYARWKGFDIPGW